MIDSKIRAINPIEGYLGNYSSISEDDIMNVALGMCDEIIEKFTREIDRPDKYRINSFLLESDKMINIKCILVYLEHDVLSLKNIFGFFDQKRFYRMKNGFLNIDTYMNLVEDDLEITLIGDIFNKYIDIQIDNNNWFYIFNNVDDKIMKIDIYGLITKRSEILGQFTPNGLNRFKLSRSITS